MGGLARKKYQVGASVSYMSRKAALKKLQLSLGDFRRLCILKGIYPQEPKHKKKVNKGSHTIKTYYFRKDIQFLLHEPIVDKFRDFKVYTKKLKKALDRKDYERVDTLRTLKPKYSLDKIVKERYPSFIDAVRDLDDCLCLVFLFATLPKLRKTQHELLTRCRRLSVEFMHYIIASRSLRKVFVSIKGIYYQAEIMGQTVNWIVPHLRGFKHPSEVDFGVMSIFIEFYVTMLGFINYRLYSSLSIAYPPKLELPQDDASLTHASDLEKLEESLAAMSQSLKSNVDDVDDYEVDDFRVGGDAESDAIAEELRKEREQVKKLTKLFKGKRFFLGRECPRESLTFVIRSCGGLVSWPESLHAGSSYPETDTSITHQVVDRPSPPEKKYLNRYYIQPQWIYDCVNARLLLEVRDYFPGVVLPPHLSPYASENSDDYVPPERILLLRRTQESEDEEAEAGLQSVKKGEEEPPKPAKKRERREIISHPTAEGELPPPEKLRVKTGKVQRVDEFRQQQEEERESKKLAIMMIPKKKKRLYSKIMISQKKKSQEVQALQDKRDLYEKQQKQAKKAAQLTKTGKKSITA